MSQKLLSAFPIKASRFTENSFPSLSTEELTMVGGCKLIALAALCVFSSPVRAGTYGDGFAENDLAVYLEEADHPNLQSVMLRPLEGMKGTRCLLLEGSSQVKFRFASVDEYTKYTLTFRATFDGGESAEENPRLEIFAANGWTSSILPQRELVFYDSQNRVIQGKSIRSSMPFRKWKDYRDTFYPPPGATYMQLVVRSGSTEMSLGIDQVDLFKTPDEGAINCNPVIGKHSKYDYSGWGKPAAGGQIIDIEGKAVFDVRYGTCGQSFPLERPGTYCLTALARPNGYHSILSLRFYDNTDEVMGGVHVRKWGEPIYFVLPPGVTRGGFLTYSNLLEEVRLVWLGADSQMMNTDKE